MKPAAARQLRAVAHVAQRLGSLSQAGVDPGDLAVLLLRFGRDVILLLKDLARDPRVPRRDKLATAMAVAYLASPLDVIPDSLRGVGQLDDLGILVLALRRLLASAGEDLIQELWRGGDEGLELVLTLAGLES